MTPAFAPLQILLVALSWTTEPGTTYTVQTSPDLHDWQTLPFVVEGAGQEESHPIELLDSPSFARLQFSTDGDSNENGLPDLWEWTHFGHLDSDPDADPDGDGVSTHAEWQAATDPTDFFNGEMPVIQLSSGSEWFVAAGEPASQVLAIGVYHLNGVPWRQAPVRIEYESGFAGIIDETTSLTADAIELLTDDFGRMDSESAEFQILVPDMNAHTELVRISCGTASSRLLLRTMQSLPGSPPRQLTRKSLSEVDAEYHWSGPSEGISAFRIQEKDPDGQWIETVSLPSSELPEPDPATGRFSIAVNSLSN